MNVCIRCFCSLADAHRDAVRKGYLFRITPTIQCFLETNITNRDKKTKMTLQYET